MVPRATWIAVELERAGYTTFSQVLDIRPGHDFVHKMQHAAATAARTIAVLSPRLRVRSEFGEAEWRAAFVQDPSGEQALLIPVHVQTATPPGMLRSRVYIDLVDCDEDTARDRLPTGVGPAGARPTTAVFPGGKMARLNLACYLRLAMSGATSDLNPLVHDRSVPSRVWTGRWRSTGLLAHL
jgi:hypothetical protein